MKSIKILIVICIGLCLASAGFGASKTTPKKKKILVVDSYHREYLWSQHINEGFCAAMLKFGYFDNKDQMADYTKSDFVETSKAIVKKVWMDSKRNSSKPAMEDMSMSIYKRARNFTPDFIFLGDDNAAQYVGKKFLDTETPMVFWGVNNTPVKYGLVDSVEKPGHNVTGIFQKTYYAESLGFLKKIVPSIKTFAVLSDATTTGRIHAKAIMHLERNGLISLKLVEAVTTNDSGEWKRMALELQDKVDAFFIAQYSGLKDKNGKAVPDGETAAWYTSHVKIPEAAGFRHRVAQGMLCAADDSGYNQGFEAVVIAHDIMSKGADPATYPPRAPKRGALIVNKERARMLGITLTEKMGIEEYVAETNALRKTRK